jgi:hypothetical protein
MKTLEFRRRLEGLQRLSREQRTRVKHSLAGATEQEEVVGLLERMRPSACTQCSGTAR